MRVDLFGSAEEVVDGECDLHGRTLWSRSAAHGSVHCCCAHWVRPVPWRSTCLKIPAHLGAQRRRRTPSRSPPNTAVRPSAPVLDAFARRLRPDRVHRSRRAAERRLRTRRRRFHHPVRDPDQGDSGGADRSRRVRAREDRVRARRWRSACRCWLASRRSAERTPTGGTGAGADARVGAAGLRGARTGRHRMRAHGARRLRRRLSAPADRCAASRASTLSWRRRCG